MVPELCCSRVCTKQRALLPSVCTTSTVCLLHLLSCKCTSGVQFDCRRLLSAFVCCLFVVF